LGLIKISSAIDYICKYVFPTLEKENHQKFIEECKSHFKKNLFLSIKIYSPDTKLKKEMKLDDRATIIIPEDWENYYITLDTYNNELKELNVDKIVPRILTLEEERGFRKANPYECSELRTWLKLDTWKQTDGLLLMVNIEPQGSDVNWEGYENFMGVYIDGAKLLNASLLDDISEYYSLPHDIDEEEAREVWKYSEEFIEELAERHEKIMKYSAKLNNIKTLWDGSDFKEERYPPKHYIDWALSKDIEIPWLEWAVENKLIDVVIDEKQAEEIGDNERNNLLLTIGALAETISNDHGTGFKKGDSPNVSEITKHVLEQIGDKLHGLGKSSLNERVSKGINILKQKRKDS